MSGKTVSRAARAGAAIAVAFLTIATAAHAQMRPKYPTRLPANPSSIPSPDKAPDQPPDNADQAEGGWMTETRKKSVEIGTQPVRDVGIMRREVPPILVKARQDPYSLEGLKTCKQLAAEVADLNQVLGPDYVVGNEVRENRVGKLAEAGGKTVVNTIIPFRGLVREISGAAPADRRLSAALDAGYARRGFLRGVHAKQGCRTTF